MADDIIEFDDALVGMEFLSCLDLPYPVPFGIQKDVDVTAILNRVLHEQSNHVQSF
jgi:hypothetical protein